MARLFKHGREVERRTGDWEVADWDDQIEVRTSVAVYRDTYANGDVKVTTLVKRQWRYGSWADVPDYQRRPNGRWKVANVERIER